MRLPRESRRQPSLRCTDTSSGREGDAIGRGVGLVRKAGNVKNKVANNETRAYF